MLRNYDFDYDRDEVKKVSKISQEGMEYLFALGDGEVELLIRCLRKLQNEIKKGKWTTNDGVEIVPGLMVSTDTWQRGMIETSQFKDNNPHGVHSPDFDGYFDVVLNTGNTSKFRHDCMTSY